MGGAHSGPFSVFPDSREDRTLPVLQTYAFVGEAQGCRENMEDKHVISVLDEKFFPYIHYYAIFDGHGGQKVAIEASKHLSKHIALHMLHACKQMEQVFGGDGQEFHDMIIQRLASYKKRSTLSSIMGCGMGDQTYQDPSSPASPQRTTVPRPTSQNSESDINNHDPTSQNSQVQSTTRHAIQIDSALRKNHSFSSIDSAAFPSPPPDGSQPTRAPRFPHIPLHLETLAKHRENIQSRLDAPCENQFSSKPTILPDDHLRQSAVQLARRPLPPFLRKKNIYWHTRYDILRTQAIHTAVVEAFISFDLELMNKYTTLAQNTGSTAVIVLLDTLHGTLLTANVGDSRAVLARNGTAVSLSAIHAPTLPTERERITQHGMSLNMNRLAGSLAISRALGDFQYKSGFHSPMHVHLPQLERGERDKQLEIPGTLPPIDPTQLDELGMQRKTFWSCVNNKITHCRPWTSACSAIPHVMATSVSSLSKDNFLLLGCDGLFDCLSEQTVVDWVYARFRHVAVRSLVSARVYDYNAYIGRFLEFLYKGRVGSLLEYRRHFPQVHAAQTASSTHSILPLTDPNRQNPTRVTHDDSVFPMSKVHGSITPFGQPTGTAAAPVGSASRMLTSTLGVGVTGYPNLAPPYHYMGMFSPLYPMINYQIVFLHVYQQLLQTRHAMSKELASGQNGLLTVGTSGPSTNPTLSHKQSTGRNGGSNTRGRRGDADEREGGNARRLRNRSSERANQQPQQQHLGNSNPLSTVLSLVSTALKEEELTLGMKTCIMCGQDLLKRNRHDILEKRRFFRRSQDHESRTQMATAQQLFKHSSAAMTHHHRANTNHIATSASSQSVHNQPLAQQPDDPAATNLPINSHDNNMTTPHDGGMSLTTTPSTAGGASPMLGKLGRFGSTLSTASILDPSIAIHDNGAAASGTDDERGRFERFLYNTTTQYNPKHDMAYYDRLSSQEIRSMPSSVCPFCDYFNGLPQIPTTFPPGHISAFALPQHALDTNSTQHLLIAQQEQLLSDPALLRLIYPQQAQLASRATAACASALGPPGTVVSSSSHYSENQSQNTHAVTTAAPTTTTTTTTLETISEPDNFNPAQTPGPFPVHIPNTIQFDELMAFRVLMANQAASADTNDEPRSTKPISKHQRLIDSETLASAASMSHLDPAAAYLLQGNNPTMASWLALASLPDENAYNYFFNNSEQLFPTNCVPLFFQLTPAQRLEALISVRDYVPRTTMSNNNNNYHMSDERFKRIVKLPYSKHTSRMLSARAYTNPADVYYSSLVKPIPQRHLYSQDPFVAWISLQEQQFRQAEQIQTVQQNTKIRERAGRRNTTAALTPRGTLGTAPTVTGFGSANEFIGPVPPIARLSSLPSSSSGPAISEPHQQAVDVEGGLLPALTHMSAGSSRRSGSSSNKPAPTAATRRSDDQVGQRVISLLDHYDPRHPGRLTHSTPLHIRRASAVAHSPRHRDNIGSNAWFSRIDPIYASSLAPSSIPLRFFETLEYSRVPSAPLSTADITKTNSCGPLPCSFASLFATISDPVPFATTPHSSVPGKTTSPEETAIYPISSLNLQLLLLSSQQSSARASSSSGHATPNLPKEPHVESQPVVTSSPLYALNENATTTTHVDNDHESPPVDAPGTTANIGLSTRTGRRLSFSSLSSHQSSILQSVGGDFFNAPNPSNPEVVTLSGGKSTTRHHHSRSASHGEISTEHYDHLSPGHRPLCSQLSITLQNPDMMITPVLQPVSRAFIDDASKLWTSVQLSFQPPPQQEHHHSSGLFRTPYLSALSTFLQSLKISPTRQALLQGSLLYMLLQSILCAHDVITSTNSTSSLNHNPHTQPPFATIINSMTTLSPSIPIIDTAALSPAQLASSSDHHPLNASMKINPALATNTNSASQPESSSTSTSVQFIANLHQIESHCRLTMKPFPTFQYNIDSSSIETKTIHPNDEHDTAPAVIAAAPHSSGIENPNKRSAAFTFGRPPGVADQSAMAEDDAASATARISLNNNRISSSSTTLRTTGGRSSTNEEDARESVLMPLGFNGGKLGGNGASGRHNSVNSYTFLQTMQAPFPSVGQTHPSVDSPRGTRAGASTPHNAGSSTATATDLPRTRSFGGECGSAASQGSSYHVSLDDDVSSSERDGGKPRSTVLPFDQAPHETFRMLCPQHVDVTDQHIHLKYKQRNNHSSVHTAKTNQPALLSTSFVSPYLDISSMIIGDAISAPIPTLQIYSIVGIHQYSHANNTTITNLPCMTNSSLSTISLPAPPSMIENAHISDESAVTHQSHHQLMHINAQQAITLTNRQHNILVVLSQDACSLWGKQTSYEQLLIFTNVDSILPCDNAPHIFFVPFAAETLISLYESALGNSSHSIELLSSGGSPSLPPSHGCTATCASIPSALLSAEQPRFDVAAFTSFLAQSPLFFELAVDSQAIQHLVFSSMRNFSTSLQPGDVFIPQTFGSQRYINFWNQQHATDKLNSTAAQPISVESKHTRSTQQQHVGQNSAPVISAPNVTIKISTNTPIGTTTSTPRSTNINPVASTSNYDSASGKDSNETNKSATTTISGALVAASHLPTSLTPSPSQNSTQLSSDMSTIAPALKCVHIIQQLQIHQHIWILLYLAKILQQQRRSQHVSCLQHLITTSTVHEICERPTPRPLPDVIDTIGYTTELDLASYCMFVPSFNRHHLSSQTEASIRATEQHAARSNNNRRYDDQNDDIFDFSSSSSEDIIDYLYPNPGVEDSVEDESAFLPPQHHVMFIQDQQQPQYTDNFTHENNEAQQNDGPVPSHDEATAASGSTAGINAAAAAAAAATPSPSTPPVTTSTITVTPQSNQINSELGSASTGLDYPQNDIPEKTEDSQTSDFHYHNDNIPAPQSHRNLYHPSLHNICMELVQRAISAGSRDNVSALLVFFRFPLVEDVLYSLIDDDDQLENAYDTSRREYYESYPAEIILPHQQQPRFSNTQRQPIPEHEEIPEQDIPIS